MQMILQKLDEQTHRFDLDRDGLGETVMDIAVDAMLVDMDAERDPTGANWPPLSAEYAEEKAKVSPGSPMAVLHGIMKTRDQLEGERCITAHQASMTFGKDPVAKQEAIWFQEGDPSNNQPPRLFFGFSAECVSRTDDLLERRAEAP
jgi:hypothetical protein